MTTATLPSPAALSFVDYADDHAEAFYAINAEWIAASFVLEEHDSAVLRQPRARILDQGGVIRLAVLDGEVVGTCALIKTREGCYELTKMAVIPAARGKKIGEALLQHMADAARALPVERLYLLTSSKCEAAIHLYEKLGWVHDADVMADFGSTYARCNVAMSYPL